MCRWPAGRRRPEDNRVLQLIRDVRDRGLPVILISHKSRTSSRWPTASTSSGSGRAPP